MNLEEAKEALKTARWKTEGLYNLHAAGVRPGYTNGHMVLCADIVEEIDKALNILAHKDRIAKSDKAPTAEHTRTDFKCRCQEPRKCNHE